MNHSSDAEIAETMLGSLPTPNRLAQRQFRGLPDADLVPRSTLSPTGGAGNLLLGSVRAFEQMIHFCEIDIGSSRL
ncbi:MAG: hypothetical protein OXH93_22505 [Caldilineaceae bacterium]|nr:hypothetical protein [Caldilineaceae bacterium]MDE0465202.1 hypothetical protein [Caldilineaceae bacterium]